jgi:hypothetical protein
MSWIVATSFTFLGFKVKSFNQAVSGIIHRQVSLPREMSFWRFNDVSLVVVEEGTTLQQEAGDVVPNCVRFEVNTAYRKQNESKTITPEKKDQSALNRLFIIPRKSNNQSNATSY